MEATTKGYVEIVKFLISKLNDDDIKTEFEMIRKQWHDIDTQSRYSNYSIYLDEQWKIEPKIIVVLKKCHMVASSMKNN